ncbi:MAG TPA: SRPBCC family protein [Actinomycetota bacterium]|nr:SRPBCC family protein [Actinomycetota bacterium]
MAGPPVEIEMSTRIEAPPEVVWTYLVDWENLETWMLEGRGFKVTSPHREGLGVTAEATIRVAGISTTDPVEVTRWEPPEVLEISHQGWVAGTGLMLCKPAPWGTFLYWKETLHPPMGLPGAIGLRLFKPILLRTFERDLRLLKELVEKARAEGVH